MRGEVCDMLVSGEMDWYCRLYRNGDFSFDKKSWDLIDKLFEIINKIKPCGEDNSTSAKTEVNQYGLG